MPSNEIRVEYIDGTPVALAVIGDKIVTKSLLPYRWAPPKKFGGFHFTKWESFESFLEEHSTLGTEIWCVPVSTSVMTIHVVAVIDGHTHYEPGAMRFRAFMSASAKPDEFQERAKKLAQKLQCRLYYGWPAESAPMPKDPPEEQPEVEEEGEKEEPLDMHPDAVYARQWMAMQEKRKGQ